MKEEERFSKHPRKEEYKRMTSNWKVLVFIVARMDIGRENCKRFLASISQDRIHWMTIDGSFESFYYVSMHTCESCLHGKMTKSPFIGKGEGVTKLLGLIHLELLGLSTNAAVIHTSLPLPMIIHSSGIYT